MSAPCRKPVRSGATCLERLADGWIMPTDLCPACTRQFMAALDCIGKPLTWHPNFLERAEQ